jgi:hypothetical protein
MTNGLSWCRTYIWVPWLCVFYCQLRFFYVGRRLWWEAGSVVCKCIYSLVQVLQDSWPYFAVSNLRPPPPTWKGQITGTGWPCYTPCQFIVILWPVVSCPVCPGIGHQSGTQESCGAPFPMRCQVSSLQLLLGLTSAIFLGSKSRGPGSCNNFPQEQGSPIIPPGIGTWLHF